MAIWETSVRPYLHPLTVAREFPETHILLQVTMATPPLLRVTPAPTPYEKISTERGRPQLERQRTGAATSSAAAQCRVRAVGAGTGGAHAHARGLLGQARQRVGMLDGVVDGDRGRSEQVKVPRSTANAPMTRSTSARWSTREWSACPRSRGSWAARGIASACSTVLWRGRGSGESGLDARALGGGGVAVLAVGGRINYSTVWYVGQ